jgi:tetratricopeptide (TPR) repeat protein
MPVSGVTASALPSRTRTACWCTAGVAVIMLLAGCTIHRFPVVRPIPEEPRNFYAAARAEEHFILARDFERRGIMKKAEREYENALALDPDSRVLRQQLIRCYIESGKFTQALILIKQGRKNDELNRDEKRLVSTVYIKMGEIAQAAALLESVDDKSEEELYSLGLIYESFGNTEKAIRSYLDCYRKNSEAVQVGYKVVRMLLSDKKNADAEKLLMTMRLVHGPQPDIYSLLARVAFAREDTAAGLALFDSALAVDSLHEETLRNKAQFHLARADFPNAIRCYRKLVTGNPEGESYGRTLAMLYYYNRQFAEAQALLAQMLETSMDDYELHYLLGLVAGAASQTELARTEIEKALMLQPGYRDAWQELCRLFLRGRDFENAAAAADRFTRALPDDPLAWRMKGQVESLRKNYKTAISSFKKALTFDSTDIFSWFELGSACERNKETDRAVKAFRKVLRLRPGDPATLNYLGYMWAEQGKNLDTAKAYLEHALKQDPQNGAFLDSYAWIFYQMGHYDSALVYLRLAADRIHDDPVVFQHLGDVLVKHNDVTGAIAAYRRSLEFTAEEDEPVRRKIVDLEMLLQHERQAGQ